MKARFLSEADIEFREAVRYYEDKAPGLVLLSWAIGKHGSEEAR